MSPPSRPGPLQPCDLRLFLPDHTTGGLFASPSRPNKRPHSPSVGRLSSPTKRRLKVQEGIDSPRFPKSPLAGSSTSARFAPAHFHALLQGPDSPAKKLDFGSSEASESTACEAPPSEGCDPGTPRRSPTRTTTRVRRSPRLSARASRSPPMSSGYSSNGQNRTGAHTVITREPPTAFLKAPREVTPLDRQSIHYPGFDIYQDPYTLISNPLCVSRTPPDFDPSLSDEDCNKENKLPPLPRKSKKASTPITPSDSVWMKAGLLSPSTMRSPKKPVPASPHPKHVCDYLALKTPKERVLRSAVSPAATLVGITPGKTPLGKDARKQLRRAMEEEADDVDGEDELLL